MMIDWGYIILILGIGAFITGVLGLYALNQHGPINGECDPHDPYCEEEKK